MPEDQLEISAFSVAEVLLDDQLQKPLDYSVPRELRRNIQPGMRVEVPFRKLIKRGTVSLLKGVSERPLRDLLRLLPEEGSLPGHLWKTALWMERYYAAPLQKVLKCMTPPGLRKDVRPKTVMRLSIAISRDSARILSPG